MLQDFPVLLPASAHCLQVLWNSFHEILRLLSSRFLLYMLFFFLTFFVRLSLMWLKYSMCKRSFRINICTMLCADCTNGLHDILRNLLCSFYFFLHEFCVMICVNLMQFICVLLHDGLRNKRNSLESISVYNEGKLGSYSLHMNC